MSFGHEDHVTDDLAARLYGELDPEREARVAAHLARCADCRAELTELERTRALLDAWELPANLSPAGVLDEGARAPVPPPVHLVAARPRWRGALAWTAAAAALLVLALGARVELEPGRLTVRFALPGAPASRTLAELVRRVAAEELAPRLAALEEAQDARLEQHARRDREETDSLVAALARQRLADRRQVDEALHALSEQSLQEHDRTREALYDLASAVAMKP